MSPCDTNYTYWQFAKMVRTERRWILAAKARKFLAAVGFASKTRARFLQTGIQLYRAQSGSDWIVRDEDTGLEEEMPLPEQRMIPAAEFIKNGGRANPPGFAYLYLATTAETALAEMRPWVGESLTLGIFEVQRPLKLVLCRAGTEDWGKRLFGKEPSKHEVAQSIWNDISEAFGRPVNRHDQESAYIPTQILAELFKANGFHGIAYQSGLERGTNIVLFDVTAAKLVHRFVYTLKKVQYHFEAAPYCAIYRRDKKTGEGAGVFEIHTESPGAFGQSTSEP